MKASDLKSGSSADSGVCRPAMGAWKKNRKYSGVVLGSFLALAFLSGQDKPRESVTVTAVEIPVRVFDGNGFVGGLTRDDFEVYENGVRQDITGFEAVSRSILPQSVEIAGPIPQAPRKRNFLLIFNVYAYTDEIGEAIDYFFKNVFSPGDRLNMIVNGGPAQVKGIGSGQELADRLKELMVKIKKGRGHDLANIFVSLEREAEQFDRALNGDQSSEYFAGDGDPLASTKMFCDKYRRAWDDYRSSRLDVNLDLYKTIAERMGKLDGDKWAICFQQRDIFPRIKTSGRLADDLKHIIEPMIGAENQADLVQKQFQEIDRSLDVNDNFPGDKIRELFTQANITFHVLLMKAVVAQAKMSGQDLDAREVRAEYEDVLRRISRATGGVTIFSNKVLETLKEASAKVDQHYLLVYQPKEGLVSPENKIEVRVKRPGTEVVSLKSRTPVRTDVIAITDFESGPRSIAFRLRGYARAPLEWKEQGRAAIKVTIFDDRSEKVFAKETTLNLVAETIRIALDFPAPAPGDFFVLIEAYDVVSGEKAVFSRAVRFD